LLCWPGRANSVDVSPGSGSPRDGIAVRHSRGCASRSGGGCSCRPSFQAQAWSARARKPVRKTFGTRSEAKRWRQEAQVALRRGELGAPSRLTVREAAEEWLAAAEAGVVRTPSGELYKPSALRSYRQALQATVLPGVGHLRLSALTRNRIQLMVDGLVGEGRAPSTVRNAVLPLRAIYRRAVLAPLPQETQGPASTGRVALTQPARPVADQPGSSLTPGLASREARTSRLWGGLDHPDSRSGIAEPA